MGVGVGGVVVAGRSERPLHFRVQARTVRGTWFSADKNLRTLSRQYNCLASFGTDEVFTLLMGN